MTTPSPGLLSRSVRLRTRPLSCSLPPPHVLKTAEPGGERAHCPPRRRPKRPRETMLLLHLPQGVYIQLQSSPQLSRNGQDFCIQKFQQVRAQSKFPASTCHTRNPLEDSFQDCLRERRARTEVALPAHARRRGDARAVAVHADHVAVRGHDHEARGRLQDEDEKRGVRADVPDPVALT